MRLVTQNMLFCNVKVRFNFVGNSVVSGSFSAMQDCVATAHLDGQKPKNFPLQITLNEGGLIQEAQEFNADFVKGILPRIDWPALQQTAAELGIAQLPDEVPATAAQDEGFLRSVHTLILEVHVKEGALVCGNCQRVYPITKGIPNMLLNEDEV